MSFDRVAKIYRLLETIVFHNELQKARVALVKEIQSPRRVLIVGEGNGRFLAEFLRCHPLAEVDCVDASGAMLRLAQARVAVSSVHFIQEDITASVLERGTYNLIVTHFLLDCFNEGTLSRLIDKLSCSATRNARWLIADFCLPATGWKRRWAQFLIAVMYRFFRYAAGIEATHLVDYAPLLRQDGFRLAKEVFLPNEMVRSQLWWRGHPEETEELCDR